MSYILLQFKHNPDLICLFINKKTNILPRMLSSQIVFLTIFQKLPSFLPLFSCSSLSSTLLEMSSPFPLLTEIPLRFNVSV